MCYYVWECLIICIKPCGLGHTILIKPASAMTVVGVVYRVAMG